MRGSTASWRVAVALAAAIGSLPASAGETEVDVALVLAVDISNSMDLDEQRLQRDGFVEAFRSPAVHAAIKAGAIGRIGVVYAEWAGTFVQHVVVQWRVIESPADALAFADELAAAPIRRGPRTSISGAIDLSMRLLDESRLESTRKVIDISGDGANNQGRPVSQARDEALAKGITINGLPIMIKQGNAYWDTAELDVYYKDCVIGGTGAFMIPVRERNQLPDAIRAKLLREVAGLPAPPEMIVPVQARPRTNCLAGERQSEQWFRN